LIEKPDEQQRLRIEIDNGQYREMFNAEPFARNGTHSKRCIFEKNFRLVGIT